MKKRRCPVCGGRVHGLVRQEPRTGWLSHERGKRHQAAVEGLKARGVSMKKQVADFTSAPEWGSR